MTRIILRGCNGRMGQSITQIIEDEKKAAEEANNIPKAQIVAGIDLNGERLSDYPVFSSFADCTYLHHNHLNLFASKLCFIFIISATS